VNTRCALLPVQGYFGCTWQAPTHSDLFMSKCARFFPHPRMAALSHQPVMCSFLTPTSDDAWPGVTRNDLPLHNRLRTLSQTEHASTSGTQIQPTGVTFPDHALCLQIIQDAQRLPWMTDRPRADLSFTNCATYSMLTAT
jgi:hypothetical protein